MIDVLLGMSLAALAVGSLAFGRNYTDRAVQQAYRKGFEDGANVVLTQAYLKMRDEVTNEKD